MDGVDTTLHDTKSNRSTFYTTSKVVGILPLNSSRIKKGPLAIGCNHSFQKIFTNDPAIRVL